MTHQGSEGRKVPMRGPGPGSISPSRTAGDPRRRGGRPSRPHGQPFRWLVGLRQSLPVADAQCLGIFVPSLLLGNRRETGQLFQGGIDGARTRSSLGGRSNDTDSVSVSVCGRSGSDQENYVSCAREKGTGVVVWNDSLPFSAAPRPPPFRRRPLERAIVSGQGSYSVTSGGTWSPILSHAALR